MAFEGLTEKISAAFKKLRGKGRLKESDVKEAMREIRMALLEADVSYKVVKEFTKSVTERCIGTDVLEAIYDGYEAGILFVIQMQDVTEMQPNDKTHAAFGKALREAAQKGVQIRAVDCIVTPYSISIRQAVPVNLQSQSCSG